MANSDQTQITLAQGANMTYAKIGSTHVSTLGSEEKHAITILVTLTDDGILLPFQAIYKGTTAALLPKKDARSMEEALGAEFLFESSKTSMFVLGFLRIKSHSGLSIVEVLSQLKAGKAVSDMKVDMTLGVLHDCTVHWLWTAFKTLNKPESVKKAWQMCAARKFNLSYESLTSFEACHALHKLPQTDPEFFAELMQPRAQANVPILSKDQIAFEDVAPSDSLPEDDSDVPLAELMAYQEEMQGTQMAVDAGMVDVEEVYVAEEDGGLVSTAEAEKTVIEAVGKEVIDTTASTSLMQARRTRKKNVHYDNDWWHDHADEEENVDG
ncbi:hypothetical protein CPB84DRAFT_1848812 [Gymnopilus junonius]|uniref:Uncharacterized protein n=1 Tax=Gymnopilus junonius TaxID=109634 RepID=A0A9P5NKZ7_GYMJU|nr:hypothetical protein CPB84DRAFT_1848812 [Gymnopilus junonius]